jgi:hypothetical protein
MTAQMMVGDPRNITINKSPPTMAADESSTAIEGLLVGFAGELVQEAAVVGAYELGVGFGLVFT